MKDIKRPDFVKAAMTSRSHSLVREMIVAMVLFFLGTFAGSVIQAPAMLIYFVNNKEYIEMVRSGSVSTRKILDMVHQMPDWMVGVALCASVGILIAAIIYCTLIEKRKVYSMGFVKKSCVFSYVGGLCLGTLMIGAVYMISAFFGSIQIDVVFKTGTKLPVLFLFLAGYLLEGMAEEALCRGFLFVSLTKRYTVTFSLVGSSVFYAFFKGLNSELSLLSYINMMLFGYFLGLLFLRFENIWFVGAFHGIWNFIQSGIMGSGQETDFTGSLFSVRLAEGHDIVHGGAFGPEGGLIVTLVLACGIAVLALEMHRRGMFVTPKPVENPYDKAYYEEFQQFMRDRGKSFAGFSGREEPKQKMPVDADVIKKAGNYFRLDEKDGEEKKMVPEHQVEQTVFDQKYFNE